MNTRGKVDLRDEDDEHGNVEQDKVFGVSTLLLRGDRGTGVVSSSFAGLEGGSVQLWA